MKKQLFFWSMLFVCLITVSSAVSQECPKVSEESAQFVYLSGVIKKQDGSTNWSALSGGYRWIKSNHGFAKFDQNGQFSGLKCKPINGLNWVYATAGPYPKGGQPFWEASAEFPASMTTIELTLIKKQL